MLRAMWLVLAALTASAAAQAQDLRLSLRCGGVASKVVQTSSTTASVTGDLNLNGTASTYGRRSSEEEVAVEITGATGRLRVPRALVPPINGGGQGGWWPVSDLVVGDDEISGKIALNFLNKPRFTIDRKTGMIDMSGFRQNFRGQCESVADAPRRF